MNKGKKNKGFTMIEIMIVVVVISLLAAIAIPSIIRIRMDANEKAMMDALKSFVSANESYKAFQNPPVYAGTVADLVNGGYIDSRWANTEMNGFRMGESYYERTDHTYSFVAIPTQRMFSAENDYCVEHTGKMINSDDQYIVSSTAGCSGGTIVG